MEVLARGEEGSAKENHVQCHIINVLDFLNSFFGGGEILGRRTNKFHDERCNNRQIYHIVKLFIPVHIFFFIRHNELSLRVVNYKGRNIFAKFQHSAFCHGDSLKFSTTHLSQISKRDHHNKRKKKKRDIFQSVTNQ